MATYAITGTSKGIGFEMVKQLSANPNNTVIGLVRDKAAVQKKVAAEIGDRPNIHILHGDLDDQSSLEQSAAETAKIVGDRGLDYLVANAAYLPLMDGFDHISKFNDKRAEVENIAVVLTKTNLVGNIYLFNAFTPLVLKGNVKKVIAISSGHADLDFINQTDIESSTLYASNKAALNVIVAKYSAQYKKDGVLFMTMSPGVVDVGHFDNIPPEVMAGMQAFATKLHVHAPHFKGPATAPDSVKDIISTWERASIETGYGGAFVSHFGNKQWV